MNSWKNKKVLVVGLGIQGGGAGVVRYFADRGANVVATDLKQESELTSSIESLKNYTNVEFHLGGHKEDDFTDSDLIVKGPSVRWDNVYIGEAIRRGVPIIMETAYFVANTQALVIGVTGSRGKSTTTTCIYETLKQFYKEGEVYIAGNVPGTCAIQLLDRAKPNDIVVLELSSWQLSGFHRAKISPHVSVFTTIYEDHLNYYDHMQHYVYDKAAICTYQKPDDTFITYSKTWDILQSSHVETKAQVLQCSSQDFPLDLYHMPGEHNKLNAALALAACQRVLGEVDRNTLASFMSTIHGLRFRQEVIGTYGDITVINDSTSTTPISTITAFNTFQGKDIILILGGTSKKLSSEGLLKEIREVSNSLKRIVLLKGSMTDEIFPRLSQIEGLSVSIVYNDFKEAIRDAFLTAKSFGKPVHVLFSPGAPSFAQFKNEFDRGEQFGQIVSAIMKE